MASVRKREWEHKGVKKTAWVVNYTDQAGKRRLKTFERKKDAEAYRLQVEVELDRGEHVAAAETLLLREGVNLFIKECERRHRIGHRMTGQTLHNYRKALTNHLIPFMGGRKISEITPHHVQEYFDHLCDKLALRSAISYAGTAKVMFDFFVRKKLVGKNVAKDPDVILPRKPDAPRSIPNKDELRHLLDMASKPAKNERTLVTVNSNLVLKLGVFGGLRVGEMSALKWEHVDFAANTIHVKHSNSRFDGIKAPKTHAGNRPVPMTAPMRDALLDVIRYWHAWEDTRHLSAGYAGIRRRLADGGQVDLDRPRGTFVFRSEKGEEHVRPLRAGSLSRYWEGLMKKAGLAEKSGKRSWRPKYTIHDMRHVAASLFIEAGLPAMNLKTVIGHNSVSTTYNVYGHLFPDDTRVADTASAIAASMLPAPAQVAFQKPVRPVAPLAATTERQDPATV